MNWLKLVKYLLIYINSFHYFAIRFQRRLERLVNNELSGLPTFLTKNGGLNSGFMTVQLCAASLGLLCLNFLAKKIIEGNLVSENKVLCHPSSADSIPTR